MELAEGLDKLAANIAESLALPPEAPGVEKPDDYYAWARPQRPRKQPATSALASPGGLVSIIILTLNNLALTRDCLASIERFTAPGTYELIAVDNGSTDGTVEYLRGYAETRPHVQAVINAENRGFAAGNNQGLTLAHGDYVVFLNNDTAVSDQWLSRMLAIFERYPETGVVGPMTDRAVGPQLIPAPLFGSLEEVQAFAEHWAQEHAGESRRFPRVIGFCLMAQRRVIAAIGGLDPRYVNGNLEDDDFCLRAIKAGFDVRLAQEVFIHHVGGQTFKNAQLDYAQNLRRNWMLFKAKWGLPSETPLEGGYQVPERVPPEALRPVALPELATSHESDSSGRWWRPRQKKEARNAAAGA
jgi:GT2 family glycosyltransferase